MLKFHSMIKKYLKPSIAIVCTFATLLTIQSCNKLASALQYNFAMNTGSVTVVIPAISDTGTQLTLGTASNTYNVDSVIKANSASTLGISNITSIKLTSCVVTITSGYSTANNFANFESCNASFSSTSNTTPYVISIPSNPDVNATSISIPVDPTAELKSYISGTTFNYSLGGKLRRATTAPITCTVQFTFAVNVQG